MPTKFKVMKVHAYSDSEGSLKSVLVHSDGALAVPYRAQWAGTLDTEIDTSAILDHPVITDNLAQTCPFCNRPAFHVPEGQRVFCLNQSCPSQTRTVLDKWFDALQLNVGIMNVLAAIHSTCNSGCVVDLIPKIVDDNYRDTVAAAVKTLSVESSLPLMGIPPEFCPPLVSLVNHCATIQEAANEIRKAKPQSSVPLRTLELARTAARMNEGLIGRISAAASQ
jgi:hypothetical protein